MTENEVGRRDFMIAGTTSMLALSGSVSAQIDTTTDDDEYEIHGVADLLGPAAARPEPGDPFFDDKVAYAYRYEASDTGERWFITEDDSEWTNISIMQKYEDAFGYPVVKNPRNTIDLPSPYQFSEERYRYIENGDHKQDPDANSTRFDGLGKDFKIAPNAGDTIEFKTAEAPRYIVGHDSAASWSFKMESNLKDGGDELTLFIEDSYELRFYGDGTAEAVSIEGGGDNVVESFNINPDLTVPLRPELIFNWYDVGRANYTLDYTVDDEQIQDMLATLTDDTDWIADDPIGRIGFRLDVANSGVELAAGSMAYIPQADIEPTGREKPWALHNNEVNQIPADGYGVLAAFRVDPERPDVFTTLNNLSIAGEQSVDTEVWLKAVRPSDTDADFTDPDGDGTDEGPAYPRMNSSQNSVFQWTPNVSTFPTRTDPVSGDTIPAGRLLGLATEYASGSGSKTERTQNPFTKKRPIYPDDVVLAIGHTPGVSNVQQANLFGGTDQDW